MKLGLALMLSAAQAEVQVAYYRFGNHARSLALEVSKDSDVQLREWDSNYEIFDSPKEVQVRRLDIAGSETASLYQEQLLSFPDGPAYIFSNASAVRFEDHLGQASSMAYEDSVAWVSKGSCLRLGMDLKDGAGSLLLVSSGTPLLNGSSDSSGCQEAVVLVGTPALSRNEISYKVSPEGSCAKGLNHGRDGYSNLDMPIGPLQAHYHTRGALYYVQYGRADYNDAGVDDDFLLGGELRYVAPGVWYGPETMTRNSYVASVHEVDPAAIVRAGQAPSPTPNTCAFACTEQDQEPARCVVADVLAETLTV
jgi:hypothetical protein